MPIFRGYLYAKLRAMGTRSEGPIYFIQISDNKEFPILKKTPEGTLPFQGDNTLHGLIGRKVRIEGDLSSNGIKYDRVVPLQSEHIPGSVTEAVERPLTSAIEEQEIIRYGENGPLVLRLQQALVSHGYRIVPDGYFGTPTLELVKEFQTVHGLTPNGIVGPETWTVLRR